METDPLFRRADDAQETARKLVEDARRARQAREHAERQRQQTRRAAEPLSWFNEDE
ncbi:DNA gyrase/topoisomerase IV subunit B [Bradyrhizobium sp. USDA 377]